MINIHQQVQASVFQILSTTINLILIGIKQKSLSKNIFKI